MLLTIMILICMMIRIDNENYVKFGIEFVDGKWVVKVAGEKGQNDEYGNGFVNIVPAEELADAAEVGVAEFFRAKLVAQPVVE